MLFTESLFSLTFGKQGKQRVERPTVISPTMEAQHGATLLRTPGFPSDFPPWHRNRQLWNWTDNTNTYDFQFRCFIPYIVKSNKACLNLTNKDQTHKKYLLVSLMTFQCPVLPPESPAKPTYKVKFQQTHRTHWTLAPLWPVILLHRRIVKLQLRPIIRACRGGSELSISQEIKRYLLMIVPLFPQ